VSGYALRVQAAIFDMDGVLIDSEPLWWRAEQEVFARVGVALSDDDCRSTQGRRTDEVVDHWFELRPWHGPPPGEIARSIDARVAELIEANGELMPGARHALDLCTAARLRLALASSSTSALIATVVRTLHLERVFELHCSAEHERLGKPDPAVYLTTARRLGIEPALCIAIEDSPAGVLAAHRAGMRVVAVPGSHGRPDAALPGADIVLRSLRELTLHHLVAG
jgi:sugar-phosphatase